jgi:para-aminobenzoate synthetase component 1
MIQAPCAGFRPPVVEEFVTTVGAAPWRQSLAIPVERLVATIGSWPEPAVLDSGPGFGAEGRWSVLAARPRLVFEAVASAWRLRSAEGEQNGAGDLLAALGDLLRRFRLADPQEVPNPDLPPFQGGLIGFFGYDLAPRLERLPRRAARDSRLPDLRFGLYDTAVVVDQALGQAELWAHDLLGEGPAAVGRRGRAWLRALEQGSVTPPVSGRIGSLTSNLRRDDYLQAVRRALDYIAAGDIFQVNLSQRFQGRGQVEPLDLFLRLRRRSPAPFAAFLRWEDCAVISASPEWFYQTRGDHLITRPIKGTRPRARAPARDAQLREELRTSPKDRAELTMIVDLGRNDLGRVCRYGTVRVVEPGRVESFATVHHLVATVEGRLHGSAGPIEIVRALFPGGSITGAPKIRAMQIIDELEPSRRSLYTGAIGYFSRGGSSAFNIAIRTILVEGDRVSFQVGGGIVADSDPEAEYRETLAKGRALRAVLVAGDGGS